MAMRLATRSTTAGGAPAAGKSMAGTPARTPALALALVLAVAVTLGALPAPAEAHGPVAPIATSYLARVSQVPAGVQAQVVDGDQRLWLRVNPTQTVVVLDYRGAAYVRFSPAGVSVNENSAMFYFNQTPAEVPPAGLRPTTAPKWSSVGTGHVYSWHDGRLHALATVAIPAGVAYVGRWSIPLRVDGRPSAIAGGVWHAPDPPIVWFWPIFVLIACLLAARRLRRDELDARLARLLSVAALAAITVAALARELHGRPTVTVLEMVTLAIVLAFVLWALRQLILRRTGYLTYFAIGFVAIWEGANLIPTLLNGFVLAAGPPFAARAACVVCLGCGVGLLVIPSRLLGEGEPGTPEPDEHEDEDTLLWESNA